MSLLEKAAYVLAPGTVVFGLLYYFGHTYATAYYSCFGVPLGDLQFSSQAYLIHSANAVFLPLWFLLGGGIVVVGILGVADRLLAASGRGRLRRRMSLTALVLATVLVFLGAVVYMRPPRWYDTLVGGLGSGWPLQFVPVLGVALCAALGLFAVRLHTSPQSQGQDTGGGDRVWIVWGALFAALMTMSLFFGAARYAGLAGKEQARDDARNRFPGKPIVLLYSRVPIPHNAKGIRYTDLGRSAGPYRYRYSQFVVLSKSSTRYYLVGWIRHEWPKPNVTVVVPDDAGVRVEVVGRPK